MSEVRKSKIAHVNYVNPKQYKGVSYHNITMENGDKINIGKKKVLVVGEELEYIIDPNGENQEFKKAKSHYVEQQNYSGVGKKRAGNETFACSYAKDIIVAQINSGSFQKEKGALSTQLLSLADELKTWMDAK